MNPYPIGIIGCGYITRKVYFPLLMSRFELSVKHVLSQTKRNWDEVRTSWPDLSLTTNWDEFLSSGIQAAFVLTPADTHYELCDRLLEAGIHILVEKPPTTSSRATLTLAKKALQKKLVLMIGFNRRFSPPIIHARDLLRGKPIRLCLLEKHRPFQQERGLSETYLEDLIHQIDLLRYICGDLTPIHTTALESEGTLLSSSSTLKINSSGLGVILHSRQSGLWQERVTIIADETTLRAEMFQSMEQIDSEGKKMIWQAEPAEPEFVARGFLAEVKHFFDCIRTGEQPITNGFEGARTQELQEQLSAIQKNI